MIRVLFYDDNPSWRANEALRERLEESGIAVHCVKLVSEFEEAAKGTPYDVVILDVMAKTPGLLERHDAGGRVVSDDEIGIELLRRLRSGYYAEFADHYRNVSVFMRTANAALHMQIIYEKEGGEYVDPADNTELVEKILRRTRRE